ncbi:MAG: ABC transporter substrate-binding protein [Candidatus Lustribacter sp.]|jgi:NitT/TauT family transport system substrate-binding protein
MTTRTTFLAGSAAAVAAGTVLRPAPVQAATTIRVAYIPIVDELPLYVGVDQGFFQKRNLDVSLTAVANQGVLISALQSGSAEMGSSVLVSMLPAQEAGIGLAAVATCVQFPVPKNVGMLARTDSGIKSAKDLAGKKVAVAGLKSYFHIMALRYLGEKNVSPNGITFVEVPFPQMPDLLKAGQIDVAIIVDPFYHRILDQKIGYQFDDFLATVPNGTIIDCYATMKDWAVKNIAAVHAFRDGLTESIAYLKANNAAALESLGKWTKQPPAIVAETLIPTFSVPVSAAQIQWWIDLAKKENLITSNINPRDMLVS